LDFSIFAPKVLLEAHFQFQSDQVTCKALPIVLLDAQNGLGLQFVEMTSDHQKNLGDFVEKLRIRGLIN
jgi:hypothetical protein